MTKRSFLPLIAIASAMEFVSCSKIEVKQPTVNKTIYGRVVEFGTDQPIQGAEFITSTCARNDPVFGCMEWNNKSTFTDQSGKFIVYGFRNHRLKKTGYWTYLDTPDVNALCMCPTYLPTPIDYYINSSTGQWDSLLIKLFPVVNITVRVRNTGTQTAASLYCQAITSGRNGDVIYLRSGIDSSFQYPVFGNAQNKIFIKRDYPLGDTVNSQIHYIDKGALLSLDINY